MSYSNADRREFFRISYKSPLQIKFYDSTAGATLQDASTSNISQSGVLFQTGEHPPRLSSLVWMSLDTRTLKICREIESRALILNNGVLGKVVRVEEDAGQDKTYDVGVCFLRKDQKESRDVKSVLDEIGSRG